MTLSEIIGAAEARQRQRLLPAAMICSTMANIHRDPTKHPDPYQPADFLPGTKQRPQGMTQKQWIAMAKQWGAALGGSIDGR